MGTIPDLVRATAARTGLAATFVEQRGRSLQDAGNLPVSSGSQRALARPVDCASLLLSLAAERVRHAPATVDEFASLAHIQTGETAISALVTLISTIWRGDRAARGAHIVVDTTEPMIAIRRDGHERRFWRGDAILDMKCVDTFRRRIEVPGMVIAAIGADLGFKGCADAA